MSGDRDPDAHDRDDGGSGRETCLHCGAIATHQSSVLGIYLCCGHASRDIDAPPIEDDHECLKFYTLERVSGRLACEHRANPNPPTGDLVPCTQNGIWRLTASREPGDPSDPDHPGAPTATRYCDTHLVGRLERIFEATSAETLQLRSRD